MDKGVLLLNDYPLEEAHIMAKSPLTWRLDLNVGLKIDMLVPLFTFAKMQLYKNIIQAIRICVASDAPLEMPLSQVLANAIGDKETSVRTILQQSIIDYEEKFGELPQTLIDLIIDLSQPANIKDCIKIVMKWHDKMSMPHNIPALTKTNAQKVWQTIKLSLKVACNHTLKISEVIDLMFALEKANSEVKKKIVKLETVRRSRPSRSRAQSRRLLGLKAA
jgi:hypothetical protein